MHDVKKTIPTSKVVNGINAPSRLAVALTYDLVEGTTIDHTQGVMLGVLRSLLHM